MPNADQFWNEPDYKRFCAYSYPIVLLRSYAKTWCGYVGIPNTHPLFGKNYDYRIAVDPETVVIRNQSPIALFLEACSGQDGVSLDVAIDCHGGITYASDRVPLESPDGRWWFGFDCNHYNDYSPNDQYRSTYTREFPDDIRVYRDIAYAEREARKLAEQLMELDT